MGADKPVLRLVEKGGGRDPPPATARGTARNGYADAPRSIARRHAVQPTLQRSESGTKKKGQPLAAGPSYPQRKTRGGLEAAVQAHHDLTAGIEVREDCVRELEIADLVFLEDVLNVQCKLGQVLRAEDLRQIE